MDFVGKETFTSKIKTKSQKFVKFHNLAKTFYEYLLEFFTVIFVMFLMVK